jgi:23S rRNA (cytidine2498-2'-O)-methyltransferase
MALVTRNICAILVLICALHEEAYAGRLMKSLRSATIASAATPLVIPPIKSVAALQTETISSKVTVSPIVEVKDKPINQNSYILTVCEAGEEKSLKGEISRNHPSLRLAFSRPGFVTFKLPNLDEDANSETARSQAAALFKLNAVFARQFAASLGSATLIDDVILKAKALLALDPDSSKRLRLHVWGRGEVMPAAGHPLAMGAAKMRVNQIRELLLGCDESESLWQPCSEADVIGSSDDSRDMAKDGEHVFDVIVPTGPFISEPLHIGHHMHFSAPRSAPLMIGHSAWPGGNPRVTLPQEAPSRAYLKIEEGLR